MIILLLMSVSNHLSPLFYASIHSEPHSLHQRSPTIRRSIPNQRTQHAKVRRVVVRLARASVPVRGLVALEHRLAAFLGADVVGNTARLDERRLVFGEGVVAWVGVVAWGRESGCHGEGGEEEGGELHGCGFGGDCVDLNGLYRQT